MNRMTTGRRKHACVKVSVALCTVHCADRCFACAIVATAAVQHKYIIYLSLSRPRSTGGPGWWCRAGAGAATAT